MTTPIKYISIVGPFTDDDLRAILDTVRVCEQKQPDQNFIMTIADDTQRSLEELKDVVIKTFPAVSGARFDVAAIKPGQN